MLILSFVLAESVWIEMSDAYGNELRRRKTSDTKMGSIKIELMEIVSLEIDSQFFVKKSCMKYDI